MADLGPSNGSGEFVEEKVLPYSRRYFILSHLYAYTHKVYNGDGSVTETPYWLWHPVTLIPNNQTRYMPHQGKRERERRRNRRGKHHIPEGKPVQ